MTQIQSSNILPGHVTAFDVLGNWPTSTVVCGHVTTIYDTFLPETNASDCQQWICLTIAAKKESSQVQLPSDLLKDWNNLSL